MLPGVQLGVHYYFLSTTLLLLGGLSLWYFCESIAMYGDKLHVAETSIFSSMSILICQLQKTGYVCKGKKS
jgi:hypothetical protein